MKTLTFGKPEALQILVQWQDSYGSDGPVGKTWGELQLWLADTLVWGGRNAQGRVHGIQWNWIDLLSFMANAWPYLHEEEQYPFSFQPGNQPVRLNQFWHYARTHIAKLDESKPEMADAADEKLHDFLLAHDFSRALSGAWPEKLLFVRQGRQMLVANTKQEFVLSFEETIHTLEALGEAIHARLANLTDNPTLQARARWVARNSMPNDLRLGVATGRDLSALKSIWPTAIEAANDDDYLIKVAARMIGQSIPDEQVKMVLEAIYKLPKGAQLCLDTFWQSARACVETHKNDTPATQGYALAKMLRALLDKQDGKLNPEEILANWDVAIHEVEFAPALDAVAVWGGGKSTTILLNKNGARSEMARGRRIALAHEMCHILVDLDGALPATEVLSGQVSLTIIKPVEQRANAFAAELLLPRHQVRKCLRQALEYVHSHGQKILAIEKVVNQLADEFDVSHETTAWQIFNLEELDDSLAKDALNPFLHSIHAPWQIGG